MRVSIAQSSDHCPLLMTLHNSWNAGNLDKNIFRYETSWTQREDCHLLIKEEWNKPTMSTNKLRATTVGLQRWKDKLISWTEKISGNQKGIISSKLNQIQKLHQSDQGDLTSSIKQLQKEADLDNLKWKQRTKHRQLNEGDRNTKFNQVCANHIKKTNSIQNLI